jgi:hypothetical protein
MARSWRGGLKADPLAFFMPMASLIGGRAMADEATKIQQTDDLPIWGAARIAAEIGLDRQATYHLLSRNLLPGVKKIGRRYVTTPSRLRAALAADGSE